MSHRDPVFIAGAAVLVALTVGAAPGAQTTVPQTAWGTPDLAGVWDFRTITPLERPDELGDRAFLTEDEAARLERERVERNDALLNRPPERTTAGGNVDFRADGSPGFYNNFWLDGGTKPVSTLRTSLVIDPTNGRLPPLSARGQQRVAANPRPAFGTERPIDSWLDLSVSDRCLVGFNAGPPLSPITLGYNHNIQLFQTPDHVAILTEMIHTVRIIPLDGHPPLTGAVRQWAGDARGRWEGDTLVVETANFNAARRWNVASENMTLIERFTRIDAETLEYTYTVIDPDTWTTPWTASIPLQLSPLPLYEYACHEGNYALPNILAGHRTQEMAAGAKP